MMDRKSDIYEFKAAYKQSVEQYSKSCDFIDGIALGSLLARASHKYDKALNLFKEWREYISEEEIESESRRLKFYLANFSTYFTAKDIDGVLFKKRFKRKRESKEEDKAREEQTVSSNSENNDIDSEVKQEYEQEIESNQNEWSENQNKRDSISNIEEIHETDYKHAKNEEKRGGSNDNKICSLCKNPGKHWKTLINCGHYVHLGCLKNYLLHWVANLKYENQCKHENWGVIISKEDVYSILPDLAKTSYGIVEFIDRVEKENSNLIIYWCYRWRLFSSYHLDESNLWKKCNKSQDTLKSMMKLIKNVIINWKPDDIDDNSKKMILNCIKDFDKYFSRCEICSNWIINLNLEFMKWKCK